MYVNAIKKWVANILIQFLKRNKLIFIQSFYTHSIIKKNVKTWSTFFRKTKIVEIFKEKVEKCFPHPSFNTQTHNSGAFFFQVYLSHGKALFVSIKTFFNFFFLFLVKFYLVFYCVLDFFVVVFLTGPIVHIRNSWFNDTSQVVSITYTQRCD